VTVDGHVRAKDPPASTVELGLWNTVEKVRLCILAFKWIYLRNLYYIIYLFIYFSIDLLIYLFTYLPIYLFIHLLRFFLYI